ncbi:MAG: chromosome segregation protein ScpA [Candidatus Methanomethylophilaceae archaeon]|nr:chromosome segregation protein ScpA [Candidatus Methanomethylophilaceae archaeon]
MDGENTTRNEALEQHLLFHKALIDDDTGTERIDKYMDILSGDTEGERMLDPMDESIRSVFSLVLEHNLDPWKIDIREFVKLYSDKVKNSMFDMIVAGKLVHMAWKILRLQSEATVANSEEPQEEVFEDFGDYDFYVEEDPLFIPQVTLKEAQYRSPVRPVSVMELLEAFEEAREEMEISAERERIRLELKAKEPRKFDNKAHDEDDEKDIELVWERIQKLGTGTISLTDMYSANVNENITTFVSILHLVRNGKVAIWQDELPRGEIFIEMKLDWMTGTVEDVDAVEAVQKQEAVM